MIQGTASDGIDRELARVRAERSSGLPTDFRGPTDFQQRAANNNNNNALSSQANVSEFRPRGYEHHGRLGSDDGDAAEAGKRPWYIPGKGSAVEREVRAENERLKKQLKEAKRRRVIEFQEARDEQRALNVEARQQLEEEHRRQCLNLEMSVKEQSIKNQELLRQHSQELDRRQASLQQQHSSTIGQIQQHHLVEKREAWTKQQQEQRQLEVKHEERCRSLLERQGQQHEADIRHLQERHQQGLEEMKQRHIQYCKTLQSEHVAAMQEAELQHEDSTQKLKHNHTKQVTELEAEFDQKLTALQQELEHERHEWEARRSREVKYLKDQLEHLNSAIVSSDGDFYNAKTFSTVGMPQKSDDLLKGSFQGLEKLVDDLSRLALNVKRKMWPDEMLEALRGPHEPRMLKQAIVQDLVWCLLYDFVFVNPYRMFGKGGEELQKQWLMSCGKGMSFTHYKKPKQDEPDYVVSDPNIEDSRRNWPVPGFRAERWRYTTLGECHTILIDTVPKVMTERVRLKAGYIQNMAELAKEIQAVLADIVLLTADARKKVEKLSRDASKLWLEYGRHRCRIVVRLPGDETTDVQKRKAELQKKTMTLTLSPILGRYGNNTGSDMDIYTVIGGGETLKVP
ncbi:hypothetical protein LTR62_006712 [Meristemomyces frigidus]|uniref:Uncharacterized protein n=1 Tax=Meristemomyces frigidus TaxID=1508187 RepID=A0AAN7TQC3_9PEZI|nr:hypothetical protein LTR62_006712 [Meristemomyces frigidus]